MQLEVFNWSFTRISQKGIKLLSLYEHLVFIHKNNETWEIISHILKMLF